MSSSILLNWYGWAELFCMNHMSGFPPVGVVGARWTKHQVLSSWMCHIIKQAIKAQMPHPITQPKWCNSESFLLSNLLILKFNLVSWWRMFLTVIEDGFLLSYLVLLPCFFLNRCESGGDHPACCPKVSLVVLSHLCPKCSSVGTKAGAQWPSEPPSWAVSLPK